MNILSYPSTNILHNIPGDQYNKIAANIEHFIIATDLAMYFKRKKPFTELIDHAHLDRETSQPIIDWKSPENKFYLGAMLMTACDIGAITKPWEVQRETAIQVYEEFFWQGDLEIDILGKVSMDLFDRNNAKNLGKMQIGWTAFVCLPLYVVLAKAFTLLKPLEEGAKNNLDHWKQEQALVEAGTPSEYIKRVEENLKNQVAEIVRMSKLQAERNGNQ